MRVTSNRLDLLETVTVDGVEEKDPLSVQFRDFEPERAVSRHLIVQTELHEPDLISAVEYRSERYWWFLLAVNGVVDPWDLVQSERLEVPSLLDYYDWFREQKGA